MGWIKILAIHEQAEFCLLTGGLKLLRCALATTTSKTLSSLLSSIWVFFTKSGCLATNRENLIELWSIEIWGVLSVDRFSNWHVSVFGCIQVSRIPGTSGHGGTIVGMMCKMFFFANAKANIPTATTTSPLQVQEVETLWRVFKDTRAA